MTRVSPDAVPPSPGNLAAVACLMEATAQKPGNVHRNAHFADTDYLSFLLSALALQGPMDRAPQIGVGACILSAVEETRRVVATNTNLGMILLLAPLAATPLIADLRQGLRGVLQGLSLDDARLTYRAIRLAAPGGIGESSEQDVSQEPSVTLLEAMTLAADRDLVARQYATTYGDIFDLALPTLERSIKSGRSIETAIIGLHLTLLATLGDTLIARKCGHETSALAAKRAQAVLDAGWPDTGRDEFKAFDAWLRADGHRRNPGATADLVAATLFVALRAGTIPLPWPGHSCLW